MAELLFDRFLGLDKKASETDLDPRFATVLKNFSTTKKPGALVKDGAYTDVSSTLVGALPSGITLKSMFQLNLTRPSETDVYLLAGVDGSSNVRVYIGPWWDGSAFGTSWVELTERTALVTLVAADISAGTTSSQIVVDSTNAGYAALSETNDYYNEWFLTTSGAGVGNATARVTGYAYDSGAGTKTFSVLASTLDSIAAGDAFSVGRTKLSINARSTSTTFATVDDVVRWLARENAAIGMTGNGNQYPTQFQFWVGYIKRIYGNSSITGTTYQLDRIEADMAHLVKPGLGGNAFAVSITGSGSTLTVGSWNFYIAFVYDGDKLGPLSDARTLTVASGEQVNLTVNLAVQGTWTGSTHLRAYDTADLPTNWEERAISPRITGAYLYARIPGEATEKRISSADIDNWSGAANTAPPLIFASLAEADNNTSYLAGGRVNATLRLDSDPTGNSHATDVGQTDVKTNFSYAAPLGTHLLAAKIITETGEKQDNDIIASIVDGAGVANVDSFGASNVINTGIYGSRKITGIRVLGDDNLDQSPKVRALVFTDDDYYVLNITSGASFNFTLDNIGEKEGLFAPDSLVYAEKRIFGVSRNGFRVYTPGGTRMIGEGLKTDFDTLTDPSEGVGAYHKKERLILFHFATDSKTYALDLLSSDFAMFEYNMADTFVWFTPVRNGDLYAVSGSTLYQIGSGSDQDGTDIVPVLRTKRFTAKDMGGSDGFDIVLTEGVITYKSDSAITLNLYRNNSATAITWNNQNLAAQTTEQSRRFLFPEGSNGRELELEVTLSAGQAAINTDFRFNSLKVMGYLKRRVS